MVNRLHLHSTFLHLRGAKSALQILAFTHSRTYSYIKGGGPCRVEGGMHCEAGGVGLRPHAGAVYLKS